MWGWCKFVALHCIPRSLRELESSGETISGVDMPIAAGFTLGKVVPHLLAMFWVGESLLLECISGGLLADWFRWGGWGC